jgi:hypothetical protein
MRENGFRAIGGLAQRLTSSLADKHSKGRGKGRTTSIARLRAEWTAIVGPELARLTQPEALLAGPQRAQGVAAQGRGRGGARDPASRRPDRRARETPITVIA